MTDSRGKPLLPDEKKRETKLVALVLEENKRLFKELCFKKDVTMSTRVDQLILEDIEKGKKEGLI